jgi:hypothetical protein
MLTKIVQGFSPPLFQRCAALRAKPVGYLYCPAALRTKAGGSLLPLPPALSQDHFQIVVSTHRNHACCCRTNWNGERRLPGKISPAAGNLGFDAGVQVCLSCHVLDLIQLAQDTHTFLDELRPLSRVIFGRNLSQSIVEIELT